MCTEYSTLKAVDRTKLMLENPVKLTPDKILSPMTQVRESRMVTTIKKAPKTEIIKAFPLPTSRLSKNPTRAKRKTQATKNPTRALKPAISTNTRKIPSYCDQ